MEVDLVYQKLKHFFPHELENIDFNQFRSGDSFSIDQMLGKKLPLMPLNQLHNICRHQEKNV